MKNAIENVTLGATYKDVITGFNGIAIGKVEYLSGCNQALIVPKASKDGAIKDSCWFDFQRLERVGKEVVMLNNEKTPGCDMSAPKR